MSTLPNLTICIMKNYTRAIAIFIVFAATNTFGQKSESFDSDYIRGYLDAYVYKEIGAPNAVIKVTDDTIYLDANSIKNSDLPFVEEKIDNLLKFRSANTKVKYIELDDNHNKVLNKPNSPSRILFPSSIDIHSFL